MNENTSTVQTVAGKKEVSTCKYVWSADGWIRGIGCQTAEARA